MFLKALPIPWEPLYPSQKMGVPLLARGLWQGKETQFRLQWHEDRVYFRLCDGDGTIWAALDCCAENEALTCWQEALANRRWGVCFENNTKIRFGSEYFFFRLHFIYASNGTGFVREYSSPNWIAFAPKETRAWAFSPKLALPIKGDHEESHGCCQFAAKSVREELLFRRVSDEEIERLSRKSSTNQTEFEEVVRWLWNSKLLGFKEESTLYVSASLSSWALAPHRHSYFYFSGMQWLGSDNLLCWLRNYLIVEGFEWCPTDWGKRRFRKLRAQEPHLRAFFEPRGINWKVAFERSSEPSFHEQLEARLRLRTWLREKAPEAEVETLLAPSTQT